MLMGHKKKLFADLDRGARRIVYVKKRQDSKPKKGILVGKGSSGFVVRLSQPDGSLGKEISGFEERDFYEAKERKTTPKIRKPRLAQQVQRLIKDLGIGVKAAQHKLSEFQKAERRPQKASESGVLIPSTASTLAQAVSHGNSQVQQEADAKQRRLDRAYDTIDDVHQLWQTGAADAVRDIDRAISVPPVPEHEYIAPAPTEAPDNTIELSVDLIRTWVMETNNV